jgi:hypothetical protein
VGACAPTRCLSATLVWGTMNKESKWYKIIHPTWKFIVIGPPVIYGWYAFIRDEFYNDKGLFKMIAWYWWIIAGLILFIILKINDVGKILKSNEIYKKIIINDLANNLILDRKIKKLEELKETYTDPMARATIDEEIKEEKLKHI